MELRIATLKWILIFAFIFVLVSVLDATFNLPPTLSIVLIFLVFAVLFIRYYKSPEEKALEA